jgi:hypothetical protein
MLLEKPAGVPPRCICALLLFVLSRMLFKSVFCWQAVNQLLCQHSRCGSVSVGLTQQKQCMQKRGGAATQL